MVVVGLQTYPDTVFNIDGVNKTPNLTFQINSSDGSLVKKFRIIWKDLYLEYFSFCKQIDQEYLDPLF